MRNSSDSQIPTSFFSFLLYFQCNENYPNSLVTYGNGFAAWKKENEFSENGIYINFHNENQGTRRRIGEITRKLEHNVDGSAWLGLKHMNHFSINKT